MRGIILIGCILFTLFSLSVISAFELPDNAPILTFISSTQDTETVAVLTTVSVDTLTNAGIKYVDIYEDNSLLERKDCTETTCTFVKTIVKTRAESHTYFAKTEDLGGNIVQSDSISINFKGIYSNNNNNIPPIISDQTTTIRFSDSLTGPLASLYNSEYEESTDLTDFGVTNNRKLTFSVNVVNVDDDSLTYEWKLSGPQQATATTQVNSYTFDVDSDGNYVLNLTVSDGRGGTAFKQWSFTASNMTVQPEIYGQAIDVDTGQPLAGINVSVYDASVFNPETNNTDAAAYETLQPKSSPDAVTDSLGRYAIYKPTGNDYNHLVFQGSKEVDFDVKGSAPKNKIILPKTGQVRVYFESASAFLKSDLYILQPTNQMLVANSAVGNQSYVGPFNNGTELKFYIRVHGQPMNLGEYNHASDSQYCRIDQVDNDTWRLHFEDLPSNKADWDYNDAVVLVDMASDVQNYTLDLDCDNDTIPNWKDTNDSWCDVGEHNADVSENISVGNFNAEGHIVYSGKYENGNKYACGQDVQFTMFGINHESQNETITFLVEDHTSGGENNGITKYTGNISKSAESLTVEAGQTLNKMFTFKIPCSYDPGKYDIHIIWNNQSWHKIGNFFIINDTTPPTIELIDCAFNWHEACPVFAKQNATIGYRIEDPTQDGTIPEIFHIQTVENNYVNIELTANNGAGQTLNFTTLNGSVQIGDMNLFYNNSGHYTVTGSVKDPSGNTANASINLTVYLPENEANTTAVDGIYHWSQSFKYNVNCSTDTYGIECTPLTTHILWDRVDAGPFGDEYATNGELNRSVVRYLDNEFYTLSPSSWLKGLFPVTYDEFNYTLSAYYTSFKCANGNPSNLQANCSCGVQPIPGNESCYRNFVPQIWNYGPLINPTVQTNLSSYNFDVSVADPNKKDQSIFTINWYVDNNLVKSLQGNESGAGSYAFDLNTTPGLYQIKAVALDYSGENVTIYSKYTDDKDFIVYTNTRTWNLNVTA